MRFISYAQNFEDVMLWRALKHVENGFYVDVGAQDPVVDSVSLAFFEQGWRGVHVEPIPHYADKLRNERPDEMVIQAAVGATPGTITFFEIPDSGLSTGNWEIAQRHKENGFSVHEIAVPCLTLTQVLKPYLGREIHWLKIDVEGLEWDVIEGWDAETIRPWVLVVESTVPSSEATTFEAWESLVLEKGYEFAYFDGLNRFFVSNEHNDRLRCFGIPPNVFDGFTLSGQASSTFSALLNERLSNSEQQLSETQEELSQTQEELSQTQEALSQAREELSQTQEELSQTRGQLAGVYASLSWRITTPLRWAGERALQLRNPVLRTREGVLEKRVSRGTVDFIPTRSSLKQWVWRVASRFGLGAGLQAIYRRLGPAGRHAVVYTREGASTEFSQLTPRARRIYSDLAAAVAKARGTHS